MQYTTTTTHTHSAILYSTTIIHTYYTVYYYTYYWIGRYRYLHIGAGAVVPAPDLP